ncbi:MAG: beta strand repeat-containing protein, partial [Stenotrophobium sp.]
MRKSQVLNFVGTILAASMLAACTGGGGFSPVGAGGNGSSGGGTTGSGIVGGLTLTSSATQVTADGSSAIPLTAKLVDTTGAAISGKTLNFSTNAGLVSGSPGTTPYAATATNTTDKNGQAVVYLQSSKQQGTATVTVSEPLTGVSSNASVAFVSGPAANISLSLAPTSVAAGGTASVNVQVTDTNGNPASGIVVSLSTTTNNSGGQFTAGLVNTDSNGRASTTYQAGPTLGTDTLKASLAGGQSKTAPLTVTVGGASPIGSIALALGSASAVADGAALTAVTATVTDNSGHPLNNVTVNFSTSAGLLQSGSTQSATVTATTNGSGTAQVFQVSPSLIGSATITASTGGFSTSQQITFVAGPPSNIVLSVAPTSLVPGGTASVSAVVSDAHGNRVQNVAVTFNSTTASTPNGASFNPVTVTTNANGQAQTNYTAPTATGVTTDTLTAKAAGGQASNQVTVSISPSNAQIGGITVTALPASVPADGSSQVTVTATVTDSNHVAIPKAGIAVNFTSTAGTPTSGTATTNGSGVASFTLTAATVPGTATVTASTGGFNANTTVTFASGVANSVTVSLNPSSVTLNGTTQIVQVSANVLDGGGAPVNGVTVNFSVPSNGSQGALASTSAVTNATGVATTTYTVGSHVTGTATDTIQATVTSGSRTLTGSASLTVANPINTVTLTASLPSLASSASTATSASAITLTALVKDANNNLLPNVTVTFSAKRDPSSCAAATGGALLVNNNGSGVGVTNNTGTATAILFTGGDSINQLIDATASISGQSAQIQIPETGTRLSISGPAAVGAGATQPYTITLLDAGNNPVPNQGLNVTSALGNAIASSSLTTGTNGQVAISYTGNHGGLDTLTAQPASCLSSATQATQSINVATQNLVIVAPSTNLQIPFQTPGTLSVGDATVVAGGTGYAVGDVLT